MENHFAAVCVIVATVPDCIATGAIAFVAVVVIVDIAIDACEAIVPNVFGAAVIFVLIGITGAVNFGIAIDHAVTGDIDITVVVTAAVVFVTFVIAVYVSTVSFFAIDILHSVICVVVIDVVAICDVIDVVDFGGGVVVVNAVKFDVSESFAVSCCQLTDRSDDLIPVTS